MRPARLFLFRRAIRIVPLYFLAVLVVWASRNPSLPGDWRDLVEHLTFTHVFDGDRIFYTLGPTWSLSLEIVFYLTLVAIGPLVVRPCGSVGTRGGRAVLCGAGCAALFAAPWSARRGPLRVGRAAHRLGGLLRAAGPLRRLRGRAWAWPC